MGQDVHNDILIDVSSLLASVSFDADEGDAIDSNGTLTINGGKIFAFANPNSGDAGLDSQNGTYINGGTIIATGNMSDAISNESKQNYLFASFQTVNADTLITIKDQDDKIITAFQTGRKIQNLFYSSSDLKAKSYKLYTGGTIEGEEENGLYTKIQSYSGGEELSYRNIGSMNESSSKNSFGILLIWITEIVLFVGLSVYYIIRKKRSVNAF